jgi:tRNA-2-methylthio-N6-dimethylallyladenosine synthase
MVDRFVDPDVVAHRYRRLEERVRAHSPEAHERLVGRDVELLVEGPSRTDASRWSGRDPANHLVHLPAPERCGAPSIPATSSRRRCVSAATGYALADAARPSSAPGPDSPPRPPRGGCGTPAAPDRTGFLSPTLRRLPVVG